MPLHGFSKDSSRLMACVLALVLVGCAIMARVGLAGGLAAFFARGLNFRPYDGSALRSSSSSSLSNLRRMFLSFSLSEDISACCAGGCFWRGAFCLGCLWRGGF
jgi:hypothetical protein